MFCLILTELILKKLMCQFEMLFAWLTFCFSLLKTGRSAIVSQLSKIFWLYQPPFFWTECKGKGPAITTKIFIEEIPMILAWYSICFVKNYRFLITGSKDKGCAITTKLFYYISLFPLPYPFTKFRELICRFIQTGGEDRMVFISTKYFLKSKILKSL